MPTPELIRGYGLVAVMMASYQACLLAAIALTSPTFVAMGTMLAVPASILFDFTLKEYVPPPVALGAFEPARGDPVRRRLAALLR